MPDAAGLPYTSFDHSKAHFYRYDEQVSLCLERLKWVCVFPVVRVLLWLIEMKEAFEFDGLPV